MHRVEGEDDVFNLRCYLKRFCPSLYLHDPWNNILLVQFVYRWIMGNHGRGLGCNCLDLSRVGAGR